MHPNKNGPKLRFNRSQCYVYICIWKIFVSMENCALEVLQANYCTCFSFFFNAMNLMIEMSAF